MSYTEDKDALGLTAKTTPIDTDVVVMGDAASPSDEPVKKITFANFRAWIEAFTSYFNVSSDTADAITEGSTNKFATVAEKAKLAYIAVTQNVDLDQMEADIAALANGMVYQGNWDASAGTFPGGGTAQTGAFYTVSVAGTVDSVEFAIGDRLIALTDNASTTTYAANWTKLDATDAVTSVDSQTGNIDLAAIHFAKTAKTTPVDADTVLITDSAASDVHKKVTWANIKATLLTYFSTVYQTILVDMTPDTDETANGPQTNTINSAGALTKFNCVYLNGSGVWAAADASATATADKLLAITLETVGSATAIRVALPGSVIRDDTWAWTVGGAIYLSETTGALTQTAPSTTDSVVRVLGYALTADSMFFMPETGVVHA